MDERTFDTLELKSLIALAARHVQTAPGRMRMLNLRPSASRPEILRELETTSECISYLSTQGRFGLSGIEDPAPILAQLPSAANSRTEIGKSRSMESPCGR